MRHLLVCLFFIISAAALAGQNALAAAEALAAREDYRASNALLEAYIVEHPARKYDLGRAWWLLSSNYLREGKLAAAREANDQSAQLRRQLRSGDLAENYLRTAEIQLAAQRPEQALQAAEQGIQMLVEDTETYLLLHLVAAQAYAATGQYTAVEDCLETISGILAIELSPAAAAAIEAYYTAAELELQRGKLAAARNWYVQAVRYDHDLDRLHQLFEQVYPLDGQDGKK